MTSTRSWVASSPPSRRPLKIFSSDPMLGRTAGNRVTIEVANKELLPGPVDNRIAVVDYDGSLDCFYSPVDLDDRAILMQGGLDPTESDPRFHQQMVYAVASRTIDNFDRALGRHLTFRGKHLRLFPHAFNGANAFYDRGLVAVLFGYFRADKDDPGDNLPGQNVFTCLSHDIIAHEVTHAVVDRLRRHFIEPTNIDVSAFHEGFADIVALFQHFSYREILRDEIQKRRADLRSPSMLVELARQFGYATGSGRALRSALDKPDRKLYSSLIEPHARGSILVAAVFDAFFRVYQQRIRDLIRIATGGTGRLADGDLHPDLVNRIADEASSTAQMILTMCIRAFEYLPPVDITFGDYLRALVTADYELAPGEDRGPRAAMIDAFRLRGIYPVNVASLAEESLILEKPGPLPAFPVELLKHLAVDAQSFSRVSRALDKRTEMSGSQSDEPIIEDELAGQLHSYAEANALALDLDPNRKINVEGFHSSFRVGPDGQLLVELIAQFTQLDDSSMAKYGGLPLRGGSTVVAAADGTVRYLISKPMPCSSLEAGKLQRANERRQAQLEHSELCAQVDPWFYQLDQNRSKNFMGAVSFRSLHEGF
jgi:hypothetical protein